MNIIPAHFLTVPPYELRETPENIQDIHYVLKITKLEGKFTVEKYPIRASLDSQFCLKTSEMAGSSLCYITSAIIMAEDLPTMPVQLISLTFLLMSVSVLATPLSGWLSDSGLSPWLVSCLGVCLGLTPFITSGVFGFGKKAVCYHSAIKDFHTVYDTRKCPQTNNALELYSVCEGSQKRFENSIPKDYKWLQNMKWVFNIEPSLTTVYKLRVSLGNKTTEFDISHELLCKYNGVLPLGTLPSDYQQRDCKEIDFCNIEFVALEKIKSEDFKQKYRVVKHFRCEHEEECTTKG